MLFGRRKPGYTTTVDAASDPEQVILDLQKAEMAAKKKPKAEVFDIDAASETARRLKETGSMFDGSAAKLGEDVIAAVQKETDALAAKQAEAQPALEETATPDAAEKPQLLDFLAAAPEAEARIPVPRFLYYGKEIWESAAAALLCGEHLLLAGPKATGKNVLAENLAAVFGRPNWDVSMYVNVDAASLIGADTLKDGKVVFREGPICQCARLGGFGVLDEVNMAKNEALAVLHATLDFRRVIDVPGYERIELDPATRFIGTMNYGYAGTRELNEALVSRFVVLDMPVISEDNLQKLLRRGFPELSTKWVEQFSALFRDLRQKCDNGEISTKALDLRGLLSSLHLIEKGITSGEALKLGIINKAFDPFERQLVADAVWSRIPQNADRAKLFGN